MSMIRLRNISENELLAVRDKFEASAHIVAKHKKSDHYIAGTYVGDYCALFIDDRKFIVAPTRVFKVVLQDALPDIHKSKPEIFGRYDAYGIIKEMYDWCPPLSMDPNAFLEWLSKEKFAYVFEVKNEKVIGDTLRLHLFGKIDIDNKNKDRSEFTGGILHALKHFAYNEVPLSTHPSKNNLNHPLEIIEVAIRAFFMSSRNLLENKNNDEKFKPGFKSSFELNKKDFFSVFYLEEETGHYYLLSLRRKDKKK